MLHRAEEATKSVDRVLHVQSDRPTDWNAAGKAMLARKDFGLADDSERAERYYREALKLNPKFAHAFYNLGKLLQSQNRDEEGEQLISQALQIDHLIGEEVEAQRAVLQSRS